MGHYTTQEFLDMFGALPDRDDPQWAGPDPDRVVDEMREYIDVLSRAALTPMPIRCSVCGWIFAPEDDNTECPACVVGLELEDDQ